MLPEAVAVAHAITVVAGKETEVSCTVANARPGPSVLWMISKSPSLNMKIQFYVEHYGRQNARLQSRKLAFSTLKMTLRHSEHLTRENKWI